MFDCSPITLETERLVLTMPPPSAAADVVSYFDRNTEHLRPWDPPRSASFLTEAYWAAQLEKYRAEHAEDRALRLMMFERGERPVVGMCTFNTFVRGAFQACTLGYSIDEGHQGRGLMYEALSRAIAFVFDDLHMHRIQANYLPINERSGRLLRRLGFVVEGYARDYLFIDGAWRDHVLTSLHNPELPEPRVRE